jgi:exodeoxyribonuclease-3
MLQPKGNRSGFPSIQKKTLKRVPMEKFKLATFNTNSIRARMPIILEWLEKEKPDVLCLQESKVQDKDFPVKEFEAHGYQAAFKGQKSYNGVAIVTEHSMTRVEIGLHKTVDEEARFVRAEISQIPVINVYVPQGFAPGTDKFEYKLRWMNDLLVYLKEQFDPSQPLLVAGDFNVAREARDVFDPVKLKGEVGFHPDEQAAMAKYVEWGLVDIFRKHERGGGHYTFWDYRIPNGVKRNLGWRIDYILATRPLAERSQRAWIDKKPRLAEKPSDHTFLVAEFGIGL